MARPFKRSRPMAVREPVQVYLVASDRALLDRVAKKAGLSRAEVLRRGVRRMAVEMLVDESPMLSFIEDAAAAKWPSRVPSDAAERHDVYLTGAEQRRPTRRPAKRRRKR